MLKQNHKNRARYNVHKHADYVAQLSFIILFGILHFTRKRKAMIKPARFSLKRGVFRFPQTGA